MKHKGFTLIEMMVVIAIIGLLLVIAIPALQKYLIRTKVTTGLTMAEPAKLAVIESTLAQNALPDTQAETGYLSPKTTENIKNITIGEAGVINIEFSKKAGNGNILLAPTLLDDGSIQWECKGGNLALDYRPLSCKG